MVGHFSKTNVNVNVRQKLVGDSSKLKGTLTHMQPIAGSDTLVNPGFLNHSYKGHF